MTGENISPAETSWLTLPELVEVFNESIGYVKRRLDDKQLLASRRHGTVQVPEIFVQDGEPISSLRGTIFVLHDQGFTDDEAIDWLLTPEESIGVAPIEALRAGHKSQVRRVAQSLG